MNSQHQGYSLSEAGLDAGVGASIVGGDMVCCLGALLSGDVTVLRLSLSETPNQALMRPAFPSDTAVPGTTPSRRALVQRRQTSSSDMRNQPLEQPAAASSPARRYTAADQPPAPPFQTSGSDSRPAGNSSPACRYTAADQPSASSSGTHRQLRDPADTSSPRASYTAADQPPASSSGISCQPRDPADTSAPLRCYTAVDQPPVSSTDSRSQPRDPANISVPSCHYTAADQPPMHSKHALRPLPVARSKPVPAAGYTAECTPGNTASMATLGSATALQRTAAHCTLENTASIATFGSATAGKRTAAATYSATHSMGGSGIECNDLEPQTAGLASDAVRQCDHMQQGKAFVIGTGEASTRLAATTGQQAAEQVAECRATHQGSGLYCDSQGPHCDSQGPGDVGEVSNGDITDARPQVLSSWAPAQPAHLMPWPSEAAAVPCATGRDSPGYDPPCDAPWASPRDSLRASRDSPMDRAAQAATPASLREPYSAADVRTDMSERTDVPESAQHVGSSCAPRRECKALDALPGAMQQLLQPPARTTAGCTEAHNIAHDTQLPGYARDLLPGLTRTTLQQQQQRQQQLRGDTGEQGDVKAGRAGSVMRARRNGAQPWDAAPDAMSHFLDAGALRIECESVTRERLDLPAAAATTLVHACHPAAAQRDSQRDSQGNLQRGRDSHASASTRECDAQKCDSGSEAWSAGEQDERGQVSEDEKCEGLSVFPTQPPARNSALVRGTPGAKDATVPVCSAVDYR